MRALFALAAPLALAACLGPIGPVAPAPTLALGTDQYDEASVVTSDPVTTELHTGDYLWECFVPGVNNGDGWKFMIRRKTDDPGADILLVTEGSTLVTPLNRQSQGGTDLFTTLSGSGRIAVATMGAAELDWPGLGALTGQCHEGEQV